MGDLFINKVKSFNTRKYYMSRKYCSVLHPCLAEVSPWSSHTWRMMYTVQQVAENNINWVVKQGRMHFWHENWRGQGRSIRKWRYFTTIWLPILWIKRPGILLCLINTWRQVWWRAWTCLRHPFKIQIEWFGV